MTTAARKTAPPGRHVILYDGHCRFCTAGARRLASWVKRGGVELADFQRPDVLSRFPGIPYEACMDRLHLVAPAGHVFAGMEAVARAVGTLPFGGLAGVYYVAGFRQLADVLYDLVAANRYRLLGRAVGSGGCEGGTCALHVPQRLVSPAGRRASASRRSRSG